MWGRQSGVMSLSRTNICAFSTSRHDKWLIVRPLNAVLILVFITIIEITLTQSSPEVFTNTFLVRLKRNADKHIAHQIAKRNGFINLGAVCINHYTFIHITILFHYVFIYSI